MKLIDDDPTTKLGQSVPHVHVHILPRHVGDFPRNDEVYDLLEKQRLDLVHASSSKLSTPSADFSDERRPRSMDEMAKEAAILRKYFV